MNIKKSWRNLSPLNRVWMVFFLLALFLNANITAINKGPCAVSACGGESDFFASTLKGEGGVEPSSYIHTSSNVVLAPTTLLLFALPYSRVSSWESMHYGYPKFSFGFDNDSEQELSEKRDERWSIMMYVVVKIAVLLSLPLWWAVGIWCTGRRAALITATLILGGLTYLSLIELYVVESTGVTTLTWSLLF